MKKTPLRRVSRKRAAALVTYAGLRRTFLLDHPVCQVCKSNLSSQVHHRDGRQGHRLNITADWLAACSRCHQRIHQHPGWARAQGFLN